MDTGQSLGVRSVTVRQLDRWKPVLASSKPLPGQRTVEQACFVDGRIKADLHLSRVFHGFGCDGKQAGPHFLWIPPYHLMPRETQQQQHPGGHIPSNKRASRPPLVLRPLVIWGGFASRDPSQCGSYIRSGQGPYYYSRVYFRGHRRVNRTFSPESY